MAIVVGTDTYLTVADSDTYFASRYGFDDWAGLGTTVKEQALVSATQLLDLMCDWYGVKVDDAQALAFPRYPDATPVPQEVIDAQCEIAFAITASGSTSTTGEQKLKSLEAAGNLEWYEGKDYTNPLVSDLTYSLLAQFGTCTGTGSTTMIDVGRS